MISENAVKLKLLESIKIHPVVNISRITMHKEQVEEQKKILPCLVEIERVEKYKVEKNLYERKIKVLDKIEDIYINIEIRKQKELRYYFKYKKSVLLREAISYTIQPYLTSAPIYPLPVQITLLSNHLSIQEPKPLYFSSIL